MSPGRQPELSPVPFVRVPNVMDSETVGWLNDLTAVAFARLKGVCAAGAPLTAEIAMSPRGRFVVTASSFSLDAVLDDAGEGRLLKVIRTGLIPPATGRFLGNRLAMNVDRSWVRRQFPPQQAPRFHSPHGWHQDGALGHDFASTPDSGTTDEGLLEMMTCWIALTPCGCDAPGLELIDLHLETLQPVAALQDETLRSRFPAAVFQHPTMEAGDALLFPGGTLHRTYVATDMLKPRVSLEVRFFGSDRLPRRLQGDRYVTVNPGI